MKKALGILSLSVLLFSTFAPSFTYANEVEDLAKEILTEELENTGNELDNENNGDATGSNTPELNTLSSIATLQTNEAPKTFEECAVLANNNTYLIKYNCGGDIIIPNNITRIIGDYVFEGQTITGLHLPDGIEVYSATMFTGAIFDGEMTINIDESHNFNINSFNGMIIGEHGKVTININKGYSNAFNWITIREGGELNIESTNSYYAYFNNSEIYGKLSINGTSIRNSIEHTYLGENGQIIIGDRIKSTGNDTFNGSEILGDLIFSEGIETIEQSFNLYIKGATIKKGLKLPKSLKLIKYSFGHVKIGGDIEYSGEELTIQGGFQDQSIITGNILITGTNLKLNTSSFFNGTKITGSFKCSDCQSIIFYSSIFDGSEIGGDIIIESNKITIPNGGISPKYIGGNLILSGENVECQGSFNKTQISGETKIIGKEKLRIASGCFGGYGGDYTQLGKSLYLSGKQIEITNSALSDVIINSGFIIDSETFSGTNGSLFNIRIGNDINIKGQNVFTNNSTFGQSIISGGIEINAEEIGIENGSFATSSEIGENIKINGNNIEMDSSAFEGVKIGKDLLINTNKIETKNSSLNNLITSGNIEINANRFEGLNSLSGITIGGDLIIKGSYLSGTNIFNVTNISGSTTIKYDEINLNENSFYSSIFDNNVNIEGDLTTKEEESSTTIKGVFGNALIKGNLNISGNNIALNDPTFNNTTIGNNFRLTKNLILGTSTPLTNYTVQNNLILGGAKTVIPSNFTLNGGLIIEDGDNALEEVFTGITVGNNQVTINGTLSNIGTHAYSFKEGTRIINTITLANDFENSDIGDGAFCIQNEPEIKVNAVTTKRFTQEEKQDLYDRTCINLTYNGVYYLTLDIDGENEVVVYDGNNLGIQNPTKNGYEFIGWFETGATDPFDFVNTPITEDKTFYAHWKALEEKAEETTSESVVYTNGTTVTIGDDVQEEPINNLSLINLVSKEVDTEEVKTEEEKITIQESEIQVTSGNTVEYQGGLEVYLEKTENVGTENETTERIEGTAKFSTPVAVKIPIYSNAEAVKVQVKHEGEEFGYTGLTLNPINNCSNGEAVNDKYNGEDISVKDANGEKFVLIYTCSASTFVAYTENTKTVNNTTSVSSPAAGGGRAIISTKSEKKSAEQEHNSADTEESENTTSDYKKSSNPTVSENLKEQVIKVQERLLTRGEVAVMTNMLLDVYPQLTENRELNEVSEACENYTDEQNFTKDEKKAITRLCKLSIMGIHADDNKPLEEFLVNDKSTNDEFSKVINRSLSTYTEKDFSVVKDALKKLEGDEENVVFGTVYDIFMSIKNIFN